MTPVTSALLTEEELRVSLNEYLNTNLDRDSLMRPTRGILVDIYSKYLDSTKIKWRNGDSPIEFYIIPQMNKLMKPRDPPYKLVMSDFIAPNRKRTNYFMNFIVFFKAHNSEFEKREQSYLEARAEDEARSTSYREVIQIKREKLEALAAKRSSLASKEQIVGAIDVATGELIEMENLGQELKDEGQTVKDEAKDATDRLVVAKTKIQQRRALRELLANAEQELGQISNLSTELEASKDLHAQVLRDRIRSHDQAIGSTKLEYEKRIKELQAELDSIPDPFLYDSELSKQKEARSKQLQDLEKEIRCLEENDAKVKAYQVKVTEAANTNIARLRAEASKMDTEILSKLQFLKPKLEETLDPPADRTYIKK